MGRRARAQLTLGAIVVLGVTLVPTGAHGQFAASGAGSGHGAAGQVVAPPTPTIDSVGIQLVTCVIALRWPAPPAGHQYSVLRTNGSTTTTIVGPTSSAGTTTDLILLSVLLGNPGYHVRSTRTGTTWTAASLPIVATGC